MTHRAPSLLLRSFLFILLPVLLLSALPGAAQAPVCDRVGCGPVRGSSSAVVCFTPATPAPSSLWDGLQPSDAGQLPAERDTTNFNEFREQYSSRNWFYGVDVQNGWVLAGLAHGIGIWDGRTNPASPTFVTVKRYGAGLPFPYIPAGESSKIVFGAIAAPQGVDTMAALAGYNGAGMLVFDLRDKTMPRPVYQSQFKTGESIYATTIGNTHYAFFPSSSPEGVFIYNLDQALNMNGCLEDASVPGTGSCQGVLVGEITTPATPYFVHGVDNLLVVSFGSSGGFQIYDVSNPLSPQLRMSALLGFQAGRTVQGVAMWSQGSTTYLGARLGAKGSTPAQTAIYDVSCTKSGSCNLGAPVSALTLDSRSGSEYLTFSRSSGNRPWLYVGGDVSCAGDDGQQREWLLDVSNPSQPQDVSPQRTATFSAIYSGVTVNKTVNYWSYYYRASPTGFNLVSPRAGKFNGDYFYRAGRSVFDFHKLTVGGPPTVNFTWSPSEIYPGTPVTFTDQSTGGPTSWAWTFQDGSPFTAAGSTAGPVTFASAGTKSVTLTAANGQGPGSATKSITVLDPNPAGTLSVSPASVTQCQPVTFTANATGAPTLAYNWSVLDSGSLPVAGPVDGPSTFTWSSPPSAQPGVYTGKVTVRNSFNPNGVVLTKQFALTALPALTDISGSAPTTDAFTSNTVQFTAPAYQGATSIVWDFGDGTTATFTDPVAGRTPSHTYTAVGTYNAKVTISNCVNQAGSASRTVAVVVTQTTPLIASFQASLFCQFSQCFATAGVAIPFTDLSTGAITWDYDWTHTGDSAANCSFSDAGHATPVTSHTYATAGQYRPCLRVKRGSGEQNVFVHSMINVDPSGPVQTPSITVSGSSAGQPNQALIYAATASNCTPSANGWTWTVTGGGTGSSTTNTISVTWTTNGSKSVSATNSACTGAQGTKNVVISSGDPNPNGPLQAAFTFSPANPVVGQAVSFDSSSSTGVPADAALGWGFGDGTPFVSGRTASHTFTQAGNYVVSFTITPVGCLNTTCLSSATKTLVVTGGTPPPPPVSGDYSASVTCTNQFGFEQCAAETNKAVTLTASTADATSYSWSFGDNTTGTGKQVSHTWAAAGTYNVSLTVVANGQSATKTRSFVVTGATTPPPPPPSSDKTVLLPWIAQTRGALVQSSDLYVHNPGTAAMNVTLEFRKRGVPETNPPRVTRTIQPGATLYVADVLRELFSRENIAGFVTVTAAGGTTGTAEPVITSFNTTFQSNGQQFGQSLSGTSVSGAASAAGTADTSSQYLVGLNDNGDRLAYFGFSNPSDQGAVYRLRFFDKTGHLIVESDDLPLSRFGQRQFQVQEIRDLFGLSNLEDYRVEVKPVSGPKVYPYGSNLRLASEDPSFIEPGSYGNSKSYLLGALNAPGLNNSLWQTDLVLANVASQAVQADVTFTSIGLTSTPTAPFHVTLQPGQTQRLESVVSSQLGVRGGGIGLLTITSTAPGGVYPIATGESYENTNPTKRYGQSMRAMSDADAAGVGQKTVLVGLRQDAKTRTTFWLFNPAAETGEYDVVYKALDGTVLGTTAGVRLGGGKLRQFSPGQHPLPAAGVANGFTIEIKVKSGKALAAAQVINNGSNDPAYIQGAAR